MAKIPDFSQINIPSGAWGWLKDWVSQVVLWGQTRDPANTTVGDPLDKFVARSELVKLGVVSRSSDGAFNLASGLTGGTTVVTTTATVPDLTPPPTPTGLSVTAGLSYIYIEWTAPSYTLGHGHFQTLVYGAIWVSGTAAPTFLDARTKLIDSVTGPGTLDAYASPLGTTWCIWIKFKSVDGVMSTDPAGGINGVQGTTGKIGNTDLGPLIVQAGNLASGAVTAAKILAGEIDATKFASGIEPLTVVTGALPTTKSTSTIFRTDDSKTYRWNGASYVATVATSDLSGTITDAQVAGLAASKVTGTLSDSQLAAISAAKITGTLSDTQLAAISAAKITGAITSTQITDGAISTPKIAAGAVTAATIAANTITAGQIAAGAITATQIAAATITGSNMVADTITATQIAANAITSAELAAGSITAGKIAAGTIQAADIAAGTITGDKLLANTITATQIATNTITAGQIAAGAIGADQIAANAITTGKLLITGTGSALNADPNTRDITAWTGGGLTIVADTTSPSGTTVLRCATNTTVLSLPVPIDALKNYQVRIWTKVGSGAPTTWMAVAFYDATGANIAGTSIGWEAAGSFFYFGGALSFAVPAAWTEYRASFGPGETRKIPAGAKSCAIGVLANFGGSGVQLVAGARLMLKADADLIVDGAIVATKLAANSIAVGTAAIQNGAIINAMIGDATIDNAKIANLNAAKITAGTLDAARIGVGSLDANRITAETITADRMVTGIMSADNVLTRGLTIRNATTGAVILSSGTALAAANITPAAGWLNSGISLSAGGVLSGAGGGTVSASGIGAVQTSLANAPAGILNSGITIAANGALSGGGGGAVTIGGLGYSGSLTATNGATWNSNITSQPADDSYRNNLANVDWWQAGATIPWGLNAEENYIRSVPGTMGAIYGPRGGTDSVWYSREVTGDGNPGGGWTGGLHGVLDTTKTYRFVVPIRKVSGVASPSSSATGLWGPDQNKVCYLNTTTNHTNPYFAALDPPNTDRWYLFIGYIFPAGSTGNTDDGAGIWDCKTGANIGGGSNFCFKAGVADVRHRCLHYYKSYLGEMIMGRPMINLVDGTQPSLGEYLMPGGRITTANASTYIADLAVDTLQIAGNAVTVPRGVYTADLPAAMTTPGEYLVQSLTMPCTGSPVTVFAGFSIFVIAGGGDRQILFRVVRDSTQIAISSIYTYANTTVQIPAVFPPIVDNPSGGVNHEYKLYVTVPTSTGAAYWVWALNNGIFCIEIKK
jgi:hypothetical protein